MNNTTPVVTISDRSSYRTTGTCQPANDKCDGGSGTDTAGNCERKTTIP